MKRKVNRPPANTVESRGANARCWCASCLSTEIEKIATRFRFALSETIKRLELGELLINLRRQLNEIKLEALALELKGMLGKVVAFIWKSLKLDLASSEALPLPGYL